MPISWGHKLEHPITFYMADFIQSCLYISSCYVCQNTIFSLLLMGFDRAMSTRGLNYKMSWHCRTIFYSNFTVSLCDYFRMALNHDWNELWPLVYWVIQIVSWCDREAGVVRNKLHMDGGKHVFFRNTELQKKKKASNTRKAGERRWKKRELNIFSQASVGSIPLIQIAC